MVDNGKEYDGEIIDVWTSLDKHILYVKTLNSDRSTYVYVKSFDKELEGFRCEDTNIKNLGEEIYRKKFKSDQGAYAIPNGSIF